MIQAVGITNKARQDQWLKFQPLIYHGFQDILLKQWTIWSEFLDIVGPIITIQTVSTLWKARNGYDTKNEPLTPSGSWEIY